VGYSDADGNGQTSDGIYKAGVMSAEWTAGAIVMVRNMIHHYHSVPADAPNAPQARSFESELRQDEQQMLVGIQRLRIGQYVQATLPGKPHDYAKLVMSKSGLRSEPYLYSSKRYRIPFGWYANPLPSTASTAWVILVADDYDPFGFGGKPN
jgi:hypothetical protein